MTKKAIIVGGPRDGALVPVTGPVMYEAMPAPIASFSPLTDRPPIPEPLPIRAYDLVHRGTAWRLDDALQPHTTDEDLDEAGGWRYVLRALS